ncbi:ArsR/SmtB family transcription factor [Agromyces allii]|uniref:Winged helix-turn-helix domain-containing protein n=1 Tax=Agromyces allii TaxID=393607 RepID=A0ABN2RBY0_9MICO|nr:winged helix-turn-helix domain-containing protein [Agromyces allii]
MNGDADLSYPARLMGEPARAAMLVALLDGGARPASELAAIAGVRPPTASAHLAQLVEGGLLVDRRLGRHRYFALADASVADAVEAVQRIAPRQRVTSLRQSSTALRLAELRSCYDHLAGRVALVIADALVEEGSVAPLVAGRVGEITGSGPVAQRLGLRPEPASGRRPAVRGCLDWTERRPHVAGALGAEIRRVFLDRGWATALPHDRSLKLTDAGRDVLAGLG